MLVNVFYVNAIRIFLATFPSSQGFTEIKLVPSSISYGFPLIYHRTKPKNIDFKEIFCFSSFIDGLDVIIAVIDGYDAGSTNFHPFCGFLPKSELASLALDLSFRGPSDSGKRSEKGG